MFAMSFRVMSLIADFKIREDDSEFFWELFGKIQTLLGLKIQGGAVFIFNDPPEGWFCE